jgi:hypothetical protein
MIELIGIVTCAVLYRFVWRQTRRDIHKWESYSNRVWSKRELETQARRGTFDR